MTLQAEVVDGRSNVYRWDVDTLSWIAWDGSLETGALTIGTVDQGTGGSSAWKVDGSAVTQPISASSLPLPTGAATAANQTTGNTSLSSIDGKLPALSGGRVPVVGASPSYDSGLVTLPNTLTALTTSTVRARGVALCNLTSAARTVTVTNTAGEFYLKDYPLQAAMTQYVELGDAAMVGIKWNASAASSVNAHLVGNT